MNPEIALLSPEIVFEICNTIALVGWITLIAAPFWVQSDKFIMGVIITLFCIVYALLVSFFFRFNDLQKFSSLQGVMELFTRDEIVVAGWVHYLAFDLLTGVFIKRNAIKYGIPHWLLIFVFVFTFMLGPIGLLMYFILRAIYAKQYFADNF